MNVSPSEAVLGARFVAAPSESLHERQDVSRPEQIRGPFEAVLLVLSFVLLLLGLLPARPNGLFAPAAGSPSHPVFETNPESQDARVGDPE